MNVKHQLRYLLQTAGGEASRQCLAALDDDARSYRESQPLPADQIRSVYGVRAEINIRNGSPIAGFDGLIAGLSACQAEVMLHSIGTPPEELFLVFTDVTLAHIFGILHIPPKPLMERAHKPTALAVS